MAVLVLFAILILIAGPVLAIIALVKATGLERRLQQLKAEIGNLSAQNITLREVSVTPHEVSVAAAPIVALAVEPEVLDSPVVASPPNSVAAENLTETTPKPERQSVEKALATRWLVWIGGIAIALGGLLLVKYAHDNGLIPPILRVIFGLIFAGALIAGGEWVRRKRGEAVKDYVPAALSAAGLVIAFGVVYAAYALYGLLSPAVCFPALVAIGLGALWLSRLQGPLIAALGLIGSYGAPALVPSEHPSEWGFFAYLAVIVIASLYELRNRAWWWLGYAAIGGAFAWSIMWLNSGFGHTAVGPFALLLGAVAVFIPRGKAILDESMGSLFDSKNLSPPMMIAIAGCVAGAAVLSFLVNAANHDTLSLMLFAIGMAAIVAFGWFRQGLVAAPLLTAALTLVVLMAWRNVGFYAWAMDERGIWSTVPGLIEPPRFRNAMLFALAGFAAVGALGVLRKAETRPWAGLAAASSFLFLFAAWGRADFTLSQNTWAAIAAALAACLVGLAYQKRSLQETDPKADSLVMLLGGAALLILFALDRLLDGVWMTIAISALAAAYAYVTRIFVVSRIGAIAAGLASFAAVRLFVGREFWGEPTNLLWGPHWVLYGYGVPAILAWVASRWLLAPGFERWRIAFEGIALGLAISLVSLELRVLIGGGITSDDMQLLELSAHALAWMGAAYGLAHRQQLYASFISLWGARVLFVASGAALFVGLTLRNPVVDGEVLQGGQFINALWLAYLAPVPLLAVMARKLSALGFEKFRNAVGIFALALLMTFITLLVKRQFQGPILELEFASQGESYSTSLAWLVSAIAIFMAGLKLDRQNIRYAGLAILILTVLKVFGYDLFNLGGLWRIASIIGLGACLIGVGWFYTRFMQNKPEPTVQS